MYAVYVTAEDLLLLRNLSSCNTATAFMHRIAVWMREYSVNAMLATYSPPPTASLPLLPLPGKLAVKKQRVSCNMSEGGRARPLVRSLQCSAISRESNNGDQCFTPRLQ